MNPFIMDRDLLDLETLMMLRGIKGKAVEVQATGNPLTFLTDLAKPLKSLLIPFTPQQEGSGDPSPSNIRSIIPWNGLTVFGGGKNLFNVNSAFQNPSDTSYENNTKRIFTPITYCLGLSATNFFDTSKVIGYSIQDNVLTLTENGGYGIGFALPLKSGKRYTIQCDGTNFRANGAFYAKDGSLISTQNSILYEGTRPSYQFVVPENTEMTVVVFVCKTSGQEAIFRNIQIEYADTATAYEPYRPITETDIVFPSAVYGGTLDVVSGVLTDNYNAEEPYDIREYISYNSTYNVFVFKATSAQKPTPKNNFKCLCNAYKYGGGYWQLSDKEIGYIFDNQFAVRDDSFSGDASAFGASLEGVIIAYEVAEPQTVTLTPAQLTALLGQNTIWSDADGQMTAVYLKKG